jgi:hypothetical protein
LRPWRGWHWIADEHGICLVDSHGKRDYHPTAAELLENPGTRQIAAIARERDEQRREVARTQRRELARIQRAEQQGAAVCLADSLRAGNCRAGTTTWAQRRGLDVSQHISPTKLLALANGDTARVQIVVAVALKRHREEMRRGFCDLAEHRAH